MPETPRLILQESGSTGFRWNGSDFPRQNRTQCNLSTTTTMTSGNSNSRELGPRGRPTVPETSTELPRKYRSKLPISDAKKKDLLTLCKTGIISDEHHEFYKWLPSGPSVVDKVPEPDMEEDDDTDQDWEQLCDSHDEIVGTTSDLDWTGDTDQLPDEHHEYYKSLLSIFDTCLVDNFPEAVMENNYVTPMIISWVQ